MKKWIALVTSGVLLGLVGCGGGSDAPTAETGPVFSVMEFDVRDAYHNMTDPENPIGRVMAGTDNAKIEATVVPVDWPSWSKMPPPPSEVIPADLRWIGTITAQRRVVNVSVTSYQPAVTAQIAVDYNVSLKRLRDGREYRDALTVYFDSNYLPLAVVTMQSRLWTWATPQRGLPEKGRIGVSSGTALASLCRLPDLASLAAIGCAISNPPNSNLMTEWGVPAVWSLQPDTAQTGAITFAYRAPFFDAIDGPDAFARSEAIVEIKTKIDGDGNFRGVEYVRIEGPLTIRLRG
jgi:hypothetical protein